jgi:cytochrome c oxidase subunit 2
MMVLATLTNFSFLMPERASTVAKAVDWQFNFILWINIIFTGLILVLALFFVLRYRYREGYQQKPIHGGHSTALELTWTFIPIVVVVVIFYYGFRGFLNMSVPPPNAYDIQVNGHMWKWAFTYPNGVVDDELHMPVDQPVRFVLSSDDVIHSLFIPVFRIKKDVVPGRYNIEWAQATKTGTVDIFCAEYCGTGHSHMLTKVVVQTPDEFNQWLANAADWVPRQSPVERGKELYVKRGCSQCHTIDGSTLIGPSWKNLYGHEATFTDGSKTKVDEQYIRDSIIYPQKQIVAGFNPVMPSFQGSLDDKDIQAITWYIKSISETYKGAIPTRLPTPEKAPAGQNAAPNSPAPAVK